MTESLDQSVYMTTFSGKKFHLFEPCVEEICIEDIAHALSLLCRFTGHVKHFYSVAQHCWQASKIVPESAALEALLHDAAEAYINDINRPMKHHPQMQGYRQVEEKLEAVIRQKFGLVGVPNPVVKEVDNGLVCTEARQLMPPNTLSWTEGHPFYNIQLPEWEPRHAEFKFLHRFKELT